VAVSGTVQAHPPSPLETIPRLCQRVLCNLHPLLFQFSRPFVVPHFLYFILPTFTSDRRSVDGKHALQSLMI
jgi:hypothetical protein